MHRKTAREQVLASAGATVWTVRRALVRRCRNDRGAITAEYAIATLAAVGLAGLLVVILRSDAVRELILGVITQAFGHG